MNRICILLAFATLMITGESLGQCDHSLISCDCSENIGIDTQQLGNCQYFTRGRPEYKDFCNPCDTRSPYFGIFAGVTFPEDFAREQAGLPFDRSGVSLLEGGLYGGSAGIRWNDRIRTELEFNYRRYSAEDWFQQTSIGGFLQTTFSDPVNGQLEAYSGMANITFDLIEKPIYFGAYAGIGAGVLYANGDFQSSTDLFEVEDSSFAWQVILGASYRVSLRSELFAEYRFLQADNLQLINQTAGTNLGDFTVDSHDIVFGIRFSR